MVRFKSEEQLAQAVIKSGLIHNLLGYSNWEKWEIAELEGFFGIPDYVAAYKNYRTDGSALIRSVAVEFKLAHWQRALDQAFRYSLFADYSFVVMDLANLGRAESKLTEFKRSNIGLAGFSSDGSYQILHKPKLSQYRHSGMSKQFRNFIHDNISDTPQELELAG